MASDCCQCDTLSALRCFGVHARVWLCLWLSLRLGRSIVRNSAPLLLLTDGCLASFFWDVPGDTKENAERPFSKSLALAPTDCSLPDKKWEKFFYESASNLNWFALLTVCCRPSSRWLLSDLFYFAGPRWCRCVSLCKRTSKKFKEKVQVVELFFLHRLFEDTICCCA